MTTTDEIDALRREVLAARGKDGVLDPYLDSIAGILTEMASRVASPRADRAHAAFGLFRTVTDVDRIAASELGHRLVMLAETFDRDE